MHRIARSIIGIYKSSSSKELQQILSKYYKKNKLLQGYCSEAQTKKFAQIQKNIDPSHWREPKYIKQKLKLSSLGLGTQGGEPTEDADLKMFQVIVQSIKSGKVNFLDTDINFRYGKSQKTINAALNYLHHQCNISRNSIFVSTKCGYIPHDIDSNLDDKKFTQILINQGIITKQDIVNQVHSIHPNFIQFCVQKSLLSLGVQTIDLLYLNNPSQSQQTQIGEKQYHQRLNQAFQILEKLRQENKIRYYGIASFISFRSPPNEEGIHASLEKIIEIARKVGGQQHGLRFILVPFNLGMPQILLKWQVSRQKVQQHIFKIAQDNKIHINLCCPLFQGRSEYLNNINNNSAKHLQFARSIPKEPVLTTVFSTLDVQHLKQDLQVCKVRYLTQPQWKNVLSI